jgi:predicted thioredoxin/glutaredoxin
MKKIILVMLILVVELMSSACAIVDINPSIERYKKVAHKIHLGDSKEKVLSILLPTQKDLGKEYTKNPYKSVKNGITTEVYYLRSKIIHDDLTTKEEFTPYLFKNGKLKAIGWKKHTGTN